MVEKTQVSDSKRSSTLQDFLASNFIKVLFTFLLMIVLFAVTFFLSYLSLQRKRLSSGKDIVPQAEIKIPGKGSETEAGVEAKTQEECLAKAGVWQKWGLAHLEYCQIPASDADKSCTDGSECSLKKCISDDGKVPGKCQKFKNTFGCFSYVEDGQISGAVCID